MMAGTAAHKLFSDRKLSNERAEHAEQLRLRDHATTEAIAQELGRTKDWKANAEREAEEASKAKSATAALAAQLARQQSVNKWLLDDRARVLAYASGAGSNSIIPCETRSGTLGAAVAEGAELLDEGRSILAEVARFADDRNAEVIACVKGWPR